MSNPESGMFFFTHIMYSNANVCLVFLIFKQEKVSVSYCRSCKFRTIIILQVMQINNEWNIYIVDTVLKIHVDSVNVVIVY